MVHFQPKLPADNILRADGKEPLAEELDGRVNGLIEIGKDTAIFIDFNYKAALIAGRNESLSRSKAG